MCYVLFAAIHCAANVVLLCASVARSTCHISRDVTHSAAVFVAEKIAGPYVWGIYDLLLLPPSFPYGGMVRCQTSSLLCLFMCYYFI